MKYILYPFIDYFKMTTRVEKFFDFIIPIIIVGVLFWFGIRNDNRLEIIKLIKDYLSLVINLLAILIGFSITGLTLFATGTSDNIVKLKEEKTKRKLNGTFITLYQLLTNTISFTLILEIFTLLSCCLYYLIYRNDYNFYFFNTINGLVFSIIFINIRNSFNFYHIFFRSE